MYNVFNKIKIKEPTDCQSCDMFALTKDGDVGRCRLSKNITFDFEYYKEVHIDCPLLYWKEVK